VVLPTTTVPTAEAAGALVADLILDAYLATDGPFHLGCPAGRTPVTTYAALGQQASQRGIDLEHLVVVMMDEFLVDGELAPTTAHFSCRRFIEEHLGPRRVVCPSPADPLAHDAIDIDVYLLASGATDGHVAFNPPGTAIDSPTRVVELAETTRLDNLATFPAFASIDDVPRRGVSVGLATIVAARKAVLLVLGAHKAAALARLLALDDFDPSWPASVIYRCNDPLLVIDEAAASGRT